MQSSLYWNSTLRADYALRADVLDPMFTGGLVLLDISGNSISSSGCIVIANQISKNRWLQGDCGVLLMTYRSYKIYKHTYIQTYV